MSSSAPNVPTNELSMDPMAAEYYSIERPETISVQRAVLNGFEVASGSSPLVRAANPVLNLVPQIRNTAEIDDTGRMRLLLIEKIREFERKAREAGVTPETIIGARYCLCTLLDEAAAQTPWGGSGQWSRHSLLVTFHNETWGGEKFFQLLAKLANNPHQFRDLLQLMYYCISLGFEGRFRIVDNGRAQLETLRQRLWQVLRDQGEASDDNLSPDFKGVSGVGVQGRHWLRPWVVAGLAALMGLLAFLWYAFVLAQRSDDLFARIDALDIKRHEAVAAAQVPRRFGAFLEAEVREGLVTVHEDVDKSTVILRGDGLFASGATSVLPTYVPVLVRVADALAAKQGSVVVSGFTDNQPIRTERFPSNVELSQERARQVAAILGDRGVSPTRIRVIGVGSDQPIADNATPAGRARNRRVEVTLFDAPNGGVSQ